jgi:hypothetical protein
MRSGSKPPSTASPTSWPDKATPTPSRYAAPRRSRLSPNPAEALRLLYAHQDDQWDGSREPDDCEPAEEDANDPEQPADSENDDDAEPGPGADVNAETGSVDDEPSASQADASEEAAHRSLQITPPPFHPDRARPRAIIYVHFSVEALTAGTGICRAENIGPILLTRLPSQNPAAGNSANPNPAAGSGAHPTAGFTSSTPPAPTASATPPSPTQSGTPPQTHPRLSGMTERSALNPAELPSPRRRCCGCVAPCDAPPKPPVRRTSGCTCAVLRPGSCAATST